MISGRGAGPLPASTPRTPALTSSAKLSQCPGSRPSGQSMPLVISLPICTMSGITPASRNRAMVSRVYANTAWTSSACDFPSHAFGMNCFPGSAQVSE